MANEVHISVRKLVEYVFQGGSIDSRFRSRSTLLDGTRIHQKVQKSYQDTDQKEVYLRTEMSYHNLHFVIDGRCDGLLFHDGEVIVDEIKSFSQPLEGLNGEGYPVHWAQAKMYAFMYGKDHELSEITVQLTYVHVESGDKKCYKKNFTLLKLENFANKMVEGYAPYAEFKQNITTPELKV